MSKEFGLQLPKIKTYLPGPKSVYFSEKLEKYESCGLSPTSNGKKLVFWNRARGANVEDVDGNIFIDCTSGFGVAAIGHNNPNVVSAIKSQSERLIHSVGDIFPNSMRVELVEQIAKKIGRHNDSQVILVNTGSEAVEVALKTAVLYTKKAGIIAFQGGFHGQSIGALSVSSQRPFRDPFMEQISKNTLFVPFPNQYRPPANVSSNNVSTYCSAYIESLITSKTSGVPPIGAIILEPIQGLNGYIVPPDDFLPTVKSLCEKHNILLIADEIFTGFGRSGAWLAVDHFNIQPDIICVGKAMTGGLPIAACVARSEIMASWETSGFIALHGSTFMSNPVNCSAALAAIKELEQNDLITQSAKKGTMIIRLLEMLMEKYEMIGCVRGKGLAIAVELVSDRHEKDPAPEIARKIVDMAMMQGILLITTGYPDGNVIALTPPFVISDDQINFVIKTLGECFEVLTLRKPMDTN